jgi:hypothetical protein
VRKEEKQPPQKTAANFSSGIPPSQFTQPLLVLIDSQRITLELSRAAKPRRVE